MLSTNEITAIADALAQALTTNDAFLNAVATRAAQIGAPAIPPDLLTKDDIARLFKISIGTVQRYATQGMPRTYLGDLPRFDPVACRAWLMEHGSKTGRERTTAPASASASASDSGVRRITRQRTGS